MAALRRCLPDWPELGGRDLTGAITFSSATTLRVRHPAADALLTGVLAVAVVFALHSAAHGRSGLTATLPAGQAMALFAAGLGMALPHVLLQLGAGLVACCRGPGRGWSSCAPLAFPTWATAVWMGGCWGTKVVLMAQPPCWRCWQALSMWVVPHAGGRVRLDSGAHWH